MSAIETETTAALLHAASACGLEVDASSLVHITPLVCRALDRQGQAYAFKLFRSPGLASKEAGILRQLAGAELCCRVQELRLCLDSRALAPTPRGPVMVTRWIEGSSRAYTEIDGPGWRQLGRALASLHRALEPLDLDRPQLEMESARDYHLSLRVDEERRRILEDRARLHAMGAPDEALALQDARLRLLEAHLAPCRSSWPQEAPQAIHNDYNVHNFIFGRAGELTVLDWDRAILAPREYEVVRCLNHLPLESPELASEFLAGYLEVGTLRPELLPWALHAAMVSHACKHWPVELALAGAPGAVERLRSLEGIVRLLSRDGGEILSRLSSVVEGRNQQ